MLALPLAVRYLRRRRTAWLALAAVTLTILVPVVVLGVMQGWIEISHKQIRAADTDLKVYVADGVDSGVREMLEELPEVAAVSPFVETEAGIVPRGSRRMRGLRLDAIDLERDLEIGRLSIEGLHPPPVLDLNAPDLPPEERGSGLLSPRARQDLVYSASSLFTGSFGGTPIPTPPRSKPWKAGLIVGRELAWQNWGLQLGQEVNLIVVTDAAGNVQRLPAEITDTIGTGVYEIDRYSAFASLPAGQYLTVMDGRAAYSDGEREVTGYRLVLEDPDTAFALQDRLNDHPVYRMHAIHWRQQRSGLVQMLDNYLHIILVVMIFIQILCIFIVYAVFSTLVTEKRHDIGVLLGLGARRWSIVMTFLIAGVVCCAIGGLLGWGLGWAALPNLDRVSLALTGRPLFPQEFTYSPETPISYDPRWPLLFIAITATIGFLATLVPAWRAGRIDPVDTIRERD